MAKFFIDAGHGGSETGAIGNGMIEKNINLIVALELKRILLLNGQEVKMSRESDMTVSLKERTDMANQWSADYFISIHHNAYNGKKSGAEVYSSINGGKGLDLAQELEKTFASAGRPTQMPRRAGTDGRDYYAVIRNTNMPSIICEYGYIDSGDYIAFDTDQELKGEALLIATALLRFIGITTINVIMPTANPHWSEGAYDYLKSKGVVIHDTRFDDKITRGEMFALLAQIIK